MPNSFILIPDISGFTEFVNSTEKSHSSHIVSELLEALIDSNNIDLKLEEIEGDALFYTKIDEVPSVDDIMKQVKAMYLAFHHQLKLYDQKRICPCGACETAIDLKLKFVIHVGEVNFINIKGNQKPHGMTVIKAHRILKNSIPLPEYLLISDALEFDSNKLVEHNWKKGKDTYDFGELNYQYIDLTNWIHQIDEVKEIQPDVKSKREISISTQIDVSPKALFEIITNLDYRLYWTEGINELKYDHNKVNRSGTEHICVLDNARVDVVTLPKRPNEGKYVLGEKTLNPPIANSITTYYIISPTDDPHRSEIKFEVLFSGKGVIYNIFKPLLKRKMKAILSKGLEELKKIAPTLTEKELL
jgi:hypothetical protein